MPTAKKVIAQALRRQVPPAEAERLYEYFLEECRKEFGKVEHGIFGAEMKVSLENDGPFTVIWDSREW